MNVLLIYAKFPTTYWGFQYSMALAGKKASLPPLGLVSLAALLPASWHLKLIDLNVSELTDDAISWADAVFVSGMHLQSPSMKSVIVRARALGVRTVVGGPAPTTADDSEFAMADVVFKGEAEQRADQLVEAVLASDRRVLSPLGTQHPPLESVPLPRYDLIDLTAYASVSLQYSRGCPFRCEFCDVIEIFGTKSRVKSTDQVLAELDALYASGYRGTLFFVDDNFIGNKSQVKRLLPELIGWQQQHGYPFELYTEASVNLASDPELLGGMVEAGFSSVFLGIETPSQEALSASGKKQNLSMDLKKAVKHITRSGIEVMGGFIIGFDQDDPSVFDQQREFIATSPIPLAMVVLLLALPGTALWRRLRREGRLRPFSSNEQFGRMNFDPKTDEATLIRGYADLLTSLYNTASYYERCKAVIELAPKPKTRRKARPGDLRIFFRTLVQLGIRGKRRKHFWRLILFTLWRSPHALPWTVAQIIRGEHLIRYTAEDVLPKLEAALLELQNEGQHQTRKTGDTRAIAAATGQQQRCLTNSPLKTETDELRTA